jgi:hypothetical protein
MRRLFQRKPLQLQHLNSTKKIVTVPIMEFWHAKCQEIGLWEVIAREGWLNIRDYRESWHAGAGLLGPGLRLGLHTGRPRFLNHFEKTRRCGRRL